MRNYLRAIKHPIEFIVADICKEETLLRLKLNRAIFFLIAPKIFKQQPQLMGDFPNVLASKNIHGFDLSSMIFLQVASPCWNIYPWIDADWLIDTLSIKAGNTKVVNLKY